MEIPKPPDVSAFDLSEDESDHEVEEDAHKSLLESIGIKKDVKTKIRKQRTEASQDISVFALNEDDGKLQLNQLLKTVEDTVSINTLKKKLNKIENQGRQLEVPLSRPVAERIERKVEYEKAAVDIAKWDLTVQKNRKAEHISFPLNQEHLKVQKIDEFLARRNKNLTPLEEEIYALLGGSNKSVEREDHDLSLLETEAISAMSLHEARQRRAELQKHRALMSFHEAKNRRLHKIKSKKYHRMLKKKKMKENVEENEDSTNQALKMRAEERATLKHRMGSKWAKNRVLMAKHDEKTKFELQEQLQKHRELVEKKVELEDINMDNENLEEMSDVGENINDQISLLENINNPWLTKMKINNNKNEDDLAPKTNNNLNVINGTDQNIMEENNNILSKNKSQDAEVVSRPDLKMLSNLNLDNNGNNDLRNWLGIKDTTPPQTPVSIPISNSPAVDKFKDAYKLLKTEGEKIRRKQTENEPKVEPEVSKAEINTNPSLVFNLPTQILEPIEDSSDDEQKLTIEQAFADDDVLAEFTQEKKKIVQENEPKEVDLRLPGWGSWGGVGIKPKKRRQKFRFTPIPQITRSDRKLGHVIINENRNVHIAKHQVNQIPFPFVNKNQFERTIARPVGPTWNTPSAVEALTKPKVSTVKGAIIQPMDANDVKLTDVQVEKTKIRMRKKEQRKKNRLSKLKILL